MVPSWNVTIINKTSTSLTVRWSNFPLSVPIQHLLVKYKDKNSNAILVYNVSNWYNSHCTGNVFKVYMFYEVYVVAVSSVNGTLYSSEAMTEKELTKEVNMPKHTVRCSRPIAVVLLERSFFLIKRKHLRFDLKKGEFLKCCFLF